MQRLLGDGLTLWWEGVRSRCRGIRRLVIYLDNGPKNSGVTRKFLRRMVQFADWSGLEVRLIYYPPYYSKYTPIERCWSSFERKWSGVLLNCVSFMLDCARRMTWKGEPSPSTSTSACRIPKLSKKEIVPWEARLQRKSGLEKYDILIEPKTVPF